VSTTASTEPSDQPVERFDPESFRGELVEAEHVARYRWAAGAAAGREVLDAGCGEGYGARLLMQLGGARRCVGVDVDERTVAAARDRYADVEGLEFEAGDVTSLPFADDSFDVVTCFETIEHVAAQRDAVRELARVLRPGGALLISSPNRGVYPPGNPFHERELEAAEFEQLLAGSFAHVQLVRQHNWIVSTVLDDEAFAAGDAEADLDLRAGKLIGKQPGTELYTLAVCGHDAVAGPQRLGLLTHGLEVRRWIDELDRRAGEIAVLRRTLAATEQELLETRDARSVAMARLERQAYWLEKGKIDLDAWMQRKPLRLAFRAVTFMLRALRRLRGRS
jgi:2-polyprenyl-3-methyl-5-hydroxy-6-metoxy-1,4-benzoquinol methylase